MVENGDMNMHAAENLNKKSLVKFHALLTKLLQEINISPQPENQKAFYA
jgi:hypothetical protein